MEHEGFPTITYGKIINKKAPKQISTLGIYDEENNSVWIDVTPKSFRDEYGLYGYRGLIRDLSANIIHELTHWGTPEMNGHDKRITMSNSYRSHKYNHITSVWCLIIHSILYDLQRIHPNKKYL